MTNLQDCFIQRCKSCQRILKKDALHEEIECQCGEVWEGTINDRLLKAE